MGGEAFEAGPSGGGMGGVSWGGFEEGCVCRGVTGGDATFAYTRLTIDPHSRRGDGRTDGRLTQRRKARPTNQQPDVNYDTNLQEEDGRTE